LVYQLSKAKSENEALSAKLKQYEDSEPGGTKRKTESVDTSKKPRTSAEKEAELREMLNSAR
jgi:hypothetical protein